MGIISSNLLTGVQPAAPPTHIVDHTTFLYTTQVSVVSRAPRQNLGKVNGAGGGYEPSPFLVPAAPPTHIVD